jgi:uncharacterized membrane protein
MFEFVYRFLNRVGYPHPIHPTEVHMPIGLVVGALVFALVALFLHRERLRLTPRHCIILAFIWVFPTILFGLMDWQHFYGGDWLFAIKVKLAVAPLLVIFLFLAVLMGRRYGSTSKVTLFVYFLCLCSIVVLGFFGGQLVYEGRASGSAERFKAGQKIFVANCGGCHPNGGNILKPNLPLKGSQKLSKYKTFSAFIRDPRMPDGSKGAMPPFPPAKIPEKEAKALYDYIINALERKD